MIALEKYIGSRIEDIKQEYLEKVKCHFCERKGKWTRNENKLKPPYKSTLNDFIASNFDDIILAKHKRLEELSKGKDNQNIRQLFNYKCLFYEKRMGYWLAERLKIDVCPYCNRQYTFTTTAKNGNAVTRPQFDHFLPKSKYPLLALSFYNLIPCCSICNLLKKDKDIELYPYSESFHDAMCFNIKNYGADIFSNKKAAFDMKLEERSNSESAKDACTNADIFQLDTIYEKHKDYAIEIIHKALYYNDSTLRLLQGAFGHDFDDDYQKQLYYGNYLDEGGIMKRPLSKLTQDIIEQFPNRKTP